MTNLKKAIAILIIGLFGTSCTKAIIDENGSTTTSDTITYTEHIQPIMFNNCTTCHAGETPLGGLDLSSYATVRTSTEYGNLIDRINNVSNPMPASGLLPENKRQMLGKWSENGFLE